jgi:histidinol-phosphatase (PHP family)
MIATYHNHTDWSDGIAPLEDVVGGARRLGVDELGISDHWVLHPEGLVPTWSMPPERLGAYVDALRAAQSSGRGRAPIIRIGLEVDWFPGHGDAIAAALEPHDFDYLIASVHEVDGFRIDCSAQEWSALTPREATERHRRYWTSIRSMAESGLFDVAAHLDLPKKFGARPLPELAAIADDVEAALDAIAAAGMVVELNTSGWHRPGRDGYPTLEILRACRARAIPATISADAHDPAHLLRDFPRAAERLAEAGYTEIARFAKRRRTFDTIAPFLPA